MHACEWNHGTNLDAAVVSEVPRHIYKTCRILAAGRCKKSRGEAIGCEYRTAITDCPNLPGCDYAKWTKAMLAAEEGGAGGDIVAKYPESSYKTVKTKPGDNIDDLINGLGDA